MTFTALIGAVVAMCGPRQRSVNDPGVGGDVAVLKFADELAFVFLAAVPKSFRRRLSEMSARTIGFFWLGEFEHPLFDAGKSADVMVFSPGSMS